MKKVFKNIVPDTQLSFVLSQLFRLPSLLLGLQVSGVAVGASTLKTHQAHLLTMALLQKTQGCGTVTK